MGRHGYLATLIAVLLAACARDSAPAPPPAMDAAVTEAGWR